MSQTPACELCPWRWIAKDKLPRAIPRCRGRAKPCVGAAIRKKELENAENQNR